jgi:hypothetical protein
MQKAMKNFLCCPHLCGPLRLLFWSVLLLQCIAESGRCTWDDWNSCSLLGQSIFLYIWSIASAKLWCMCNFLSPVAFTYSIHVQLHSYLDQQTYGFYLSHKVIDIFMYCLHYRLSTLFLVKTLVVAHTWLPKHRIIMWYSRSLFKLGCSRTQRISDSWPAKLYVSWLLADAFYGCGFLAFLNCNFYLRLGHIENMVPIGSSNRK